MYSLKYKVTTSTCDSEGRLKLYSALQMMQDCSEMWIDSEPEVKDYFLQQNMAQLLATRQVEIVRVPDYKEELTVTTSVYGIDKWKAKQGSWRISEATLLLLAVIGGSIGALLGMQVWHHKTMHKKFKYGLPLILLSQIALIYLIIQK